MIPILNTNRADTNYMNKKAEFKTKSILKNLFFFVTAVGGQFFIVHGKTISSHFFAHKEQFLSAKFDNIWVYLIILLISLIFLMIKLKVKDKTKQIFFTVVTGMIGAISIVFFGFSSPLILVLLLYLYGVMAIIIVIEPVLSKTMDIEFWKFLFENIIKLIKYFLVIFGILFTVLEFLVKQINESNISFLTTLFYPSMILVLSFFMIGFWIILPVWNKIEEGYGDNNPNLNNLTRT